MIPYLLLLAAILACAGMFIYARWIERSRIHVTRMKYRLPDLPESLQGRRIVAFSDLHVSEDDPRGLLTKLQKRVNAENPDYICFLGDLFDNYPAFAKAWKDAHPKASEQDAVSRLRECLSGMEAGSLKAAVLGNHDYEMTGNSVVRDVLNSAGFVLLDGESVLKNGVGIGGCADFIMADDEGEVPPIPGQLRLLLCHEPDPALQFPRHTFDLMLSGHTHGGQVRLPVISNLYQPTRGRRFRYGSYRLDGGARLFVTRGIGCSLLMLRLGAAPEIVSIRLEAGSRARLLHDYPEKPKKSFLQDKID